MKDKDYMQMVLDDEHEFWDEYGRHPVFAKLAFIAIASQGLIWASLKARFRPDLHFIRLDDVG